MNSKVLLIGVVFTSAILNAEIAEGMQKSQNQQKETSYFFADITQRENFKGQFEKFSPDKTREIRDFWSFMSELFRHHSGASQMFYHLPGVILFIPDAFPAQKEMNSLFESWNLLLSIKKGELSVSDAQFMSAAEELFNTQNKVLEDLRAVLQENPTDNKWEIWHPGYYSEDFQRAIPLALWTANWFAQKASSCENEDGSEKLQEAAKLWENIHKLQTRLTETAPIACQQAKDFLIWWKTKIELIKEQEKLEGSLFQIWNLIPKEEWEELKIERASHMIQDWIRLKSRKNDTLSGKERNCIENKLSEVKDELEVLSPAFVKKCTRKCFSEQNYDQAKEVIQLTLVVRVNEWLQFYINEDSESASQNEKIKYLQQMESELKEVDDPQLLKETMKNFIENNPDWNDELNELARRLEIVIELQK